MKKQMKLSPSLPDLLIPWYQKNARDLPWRKDNDPYHVWISEIMLQQTRVEVVKDYYTRFLAALPSLADLAAVPDDALLKLWEGLGYYSRAHNLKKAAQVILMDYDARFPREYEQILALPGIGPYTAGAVCSICFGLPVPAVDGNVLRVVARLTEMDDDITQNATKKAVATALEKIYPKKTGGLFTQALMELGATVCVPNGIPRCGLCPAQSLCRAYRNKTAMHFPVKAKAKARKIEKRTVFILTCGDKIALRKRDDSGLLAGMWEFPNLPAELDERQAAEQAAAWYTTPRQLIKSARRKHIFSHIEWHMTGYYLTCATAPDRFRWVTRAELKQDIALPAPFHLFLDENHPAF